MNNLIACLSFMLFFAGIADAQSNITAETNILDTLSIEKNTALLMYKVSPDGITVHKKTNDALSSHKVEIDSFFESKILELHDAIRSKSDSLDLYTPYEKLLLPLEPLPENLVIIPESYLTFLPFEALIKRKMQVDQGFPEYPFVIKEHNIFYNYAVSEMIKMRESTATGKGTFFYLPENVAEEEKEWKKEVGNIRNDFGGEAVFSDLSDISDFKQHFSGMHNFHFAGFSQFDGDNSFLRLGYKGENIDLEYFCQSFSNLNFLVLSGNTVNANNDKAISRPIGMLADSGTKSLIYSQWPLNTYSRRLILEKYYKEIFDASRKHEALKKAKLYYIGQSANRDEAHPYYWAGFIGVGDYNSISSEVPSYVYLILLLIIVILFLIYRKYNRSLF